MDSGMYMICSAVSNARAYPDVTCADYKKGTGPFHFILRRTYAVTVCNHWHGFSKQIRPRATSNSD